MRNAKCGLRNTEIDEEINAWQAKTFPKQTVESKIEHLIREAKELREAPRDMMEKADIFILFLGICAMTETSWGQVVAAARAKFEICKRRQWHEADADGVHHHVDEDYQ